MRKRKYTAVNELTIEIAFHWLMKINQHGISFSRWFQIFPPLSICTCCSFHKELVHVSPPVESGLNLMASINAILGD